MFYSNILFHAWYFYVLDSEKWLDFVDLPFYSKMLDDDILIENYENYLRLSSELLEQTIWTNSIGLQNLSFLGVTNTEWPSEFSQDDFDAKESLPIEVGNAKYNNAIAISNSLPLPPPLYQLVLEPTFTPVETQSDLISR